MSAAHPWLEELPWPTEKMPRDQLYKRIEHTLTMVNMGVLATTGKNGAIASPIEFYAEGLTAYMYPQPGSPKIKAMQSDPRVSFAVHTPVVGWVSCRGAQLFGQAEILEPGARHNQKLRKLTLNLDQLIRARHRYKFRIRYLKEWPQLDAAVFKMLQSFFLVDEIGPAAHE